jgi:hypothetical protein
MGWLRSKIAQTLAEADGEDWRELSNTGGCGRWLTLADTTLAIPEIAEALAKQARQAEIDERNAAAKKAMRPAPLHNLTHRISTAD